MMNELKEFNRKKKEVKKNKFPSIKGIYLEGVPGWRPGDTFILYIDPQQETFNFFNLINEASLPLSRVKDAASITEQEVEEYQANQLAKGMAVTALIGPIAGLIVGTNKKTKKKKSYHTFLSVLYEDKEGDEKTLVFQTPSETNTALYFNKFLTALKPYLPDKKEEQTITGKVEL